VLAVCIVVVVWFLEGFLSILQSPQNIKSLGLPRPESSWTAFDLQNVPSLDWSILATVAIARLDCIWAMAMMA
jgi:hypothetical protein